MTPTYLTHLSKLGLVAVLSYAGIGTAFAACKPPKSDYKNVSCTAQSGVYLATKDDGSPVALLDNKGKRTADLFTYHAVLAHQFGDGLMPVQLGGKVGYINKNGKTAINAQYDRMPTGAWARGVSDGRIVVYKNGAFGVIDTRGKTVVGFDRSISNITDFQHGVATVTKGNQRYQIDTSGKRIASTPATPTPAPQVATEPSSPPPPPSYTQTKPPPASVTISQTSSNVLGASSANIVAQPTSTTPAVSQAFVSSSVVSTPVNQGATVSAVPMRSSTTSPPFFPAQQNGKWGFIDANGVAMIQYVFDEVQSYSEGLAAVRMGNRWGYIDGRGDLVIDFRFENSGVMTNGATPTLPSTPFKFENDRAWIGNLANGTKMCIDRQGNPAACQD